MRSPVSSVEGEITRRSDTVPAVFKMRFVQFLQDDKRCIGIELAENGDYINLNAADPCFPRDMRSFIEDGDSLMQAAKRSEQVHMYII